MYLPIIVRFILGLLRRSWTPAQPWLSIPSALIGFIIGVVSLMAGLGIGLQASPGLLGLILVWGLIAAGLQFVLTLQSVWGK
jgi:hypothetical protein